MERINFDLRKQGLNEMNWKIRQKNFVEVVYLQEVMAIYPCFRTEFI